MPNQSKVKSTKKIEIPDFQTEAEEADWYASRDGRSYAEQLFTDGEKTGVLKAKLGGAVKRTDPAILAELKARVRAKQTLPVSLRLPVSDIERAKSLAAKVGIGYQTLLKEMISEGLRRAN